MIHAQIRANTRPQEIITGLRQQHGGTNVLLRDIYNEKRLWTKWQLNGETPTEALLLQLQTSSEWIFSYKLDHENRLTHLLFAYQKAITVFQSHPDILMADCTYRTNRFNMPLLHLLGVTATNDHFSAAWVVMSDELESSYHWALEQFHAYVCAPIDRTPNIFGSDNETALKNAAHAVWPQTPQYLCYWHVQKNVLTALQKYFRRVNGHTEMTPSDIKLRDGFQAAVDKMNWATNEEEYERLWGVLQQKYRPYSGLVRYICENQYPQRKEVARAWTSKLQHYGNTTTSKLESSHRTLKGYLLNSRGDLFWMVNAFQNCIDNWIEEYKGKLSRIYDRPKPRADAKSIDCCHDNLNKHVTNFAMEQFAKQLALAQSADMKPECSGAFIAIYGIPCCHEIKKVIDTNLQFTANDFDPHWLWERDDYENEIVDIADIIEERRANQPLIFAPTTVVRKKGRPKQNKRILSQFEATRPGTKKRRIEPTPHPTPQPTATPGGTVVISDDEEDDDDSTYPPMPTADLARRRARGPSELANGDFIDINHPSLADQIDLTDPAVTTARKPTKVASRATTTTSKTRSQSTAKPRGRVSKARKEQAYNEVVKALSKAGCPADLRQLTALETDWYSNDQDTALTTLLAAMTRAGNTASTKQYKVMEQAICVSK